MEAAPRRDIPSAARALAEQIGQEPAVRRVLLFGSRARGDHGPRSDVDLAVEAPGLSRRAWLDCVAFAEDAPTLLRVDLVRLDEAAPGLRHQILAEGLTLYERGPREQPA